jgi:hypothetical protein
MELMDYWGQHPPTHLLIGWNMGINGKEKPKQLDQCTDDEFSEFLGMVNGV